MGRIIDESAVTTLATTDVLIKDNPSTGSAKISWSDLAAQIDARYLSGGKLLSSLVPPSFAGGLTYKGSIAGASVPASSGATGDYYLISSAGTSQAITWAVGDLAVWNGAAWQKVPQFSSGTLTAPDSTDYIIAGGSSGAGLTLGQGANGSVTITPTGSGYLILGGASGGGIKLPTLGGKTPMLVTRSGGGGATLKLTSQGDFSFAIFREEAPVAPSLLGLLEFEGLDASGSAFAYGQLRSDITDITTGAPSGKLTMQVLNAGALANAQIWNADGSSVFQSVGGSKTATILTDNSYAYLHSSADLWLSANAGSGTAYVDAVRLNARGTAAPTTPATGAFVVGSTAGSQIGMGAGQIFFQAASGKIGHLYTDASYTYLASNGDIWLSPNGGSGTTYADGPLTARSTLTVQGTGTSSFAGPIQTAAPGGAAAAMKFGGVIAATVTLDTANYWEVSIGGSVKKVLLAA